MSLLSDESVAEDSVVVVWRSSLAQPVKLRSETVKRQARISFFIRWNS